MSRINTALFPNDEPTVEPPLKATTKMASPNETKLPEQQPSSSNCTTPPTPTAAEFPSEEIAENQAQKEDEAAVRTPVADAFDMETHRFEEAQGRPEPVAPDTAAGDFQAGAVRPQQQDPTEAVTMALARATAPNDEEDSDSEFQELLDAEDGENELDDRLFVDQEPDSLIGECNADRTAVYGDDSGSTKQEGRLGEDPIVQELSPFNAEAGQAIRIGDDLRDFGIHAQGFQDYPETSSEADAWNNEEGHIEAVGDSEAGQASPDQTTSAAPAEPARAGGSESGIVTALPLGSDPGDGDNNDSTAPASIGSDHDDGGNKGTMVSASTGFDHGNAERSGLATPALTFSACSEKENNDSMTPDSTDSGHEDHEHGTSATAAPTGSDNGNEEHKGSLTATLAGPDDGNRESSGSTTAPTNQASSPSGLDDPILKTGSKDLDTIHLNIQYLVACSNRSKATMCISVPAFITYPSLKKTIEDALCEHDGFINPRPIDPDAKISRLIVALAKNKTGERDFCRIRELTDENLGETLRLMRTRSIYDVVKVQFKPGTNGKATPRKANGRIYGRSRKIGGL